VIRDVQQYILSRLDQDYSLRQHIRRDTAEMLNQLHIKSNGCFLYLEKVLDGISENFIVLREIREIPGTLYGLFLWLCQRLFTKKQFAKVQNILNILLASRKPLTEEELLLCIRSKFPSLSKEEFLKRLHVLRRVLIRSQESTFILFHHSFAEWLLDVKYCTQKYLCQAGDGHSMLSVVMASQMPDVMDHPAEITELAYHLTRVPKSTLDPSLAPLFLLSSGAKVTGEEFNMEGYDSKVVKLLAACGARRLSICSSSSSGPDDEKVVDRDNEGQLVLNSDSVVLLGDEEVEPRIVSAAELGANETELIGGTTGNNGEVPPEEEEEDAPFVFSGDMNQVDYNQRTPLHNGSNDGNLELVKLLLAHGVPLETIDRHGRTPLNLAARQVSF